MTRRCELMIGETQCPNDATYRYTWPGKDEAIVCEEHVHKLRAVARALGMYMQTVKICDS